MNAEASAEHLAVAPLAGLVPNLESQSGYAKVIASLKAGYAATLGGVWGSSCALVAASLAQHSRGPVVAVFAHGDQVDDFVDDFALFNTLPVERFPASDARSSDRVLQDEAYGDRLRLLKRLVHEGSPPVIATTIQSLLQPVPRRATLEAQTRRLRRGDIINIDELLRWLLENGFHSTTAVELPGEYSSRGGILDIYAPDWLQPVRLELFGDEIESLRMFEVATQRSLAAVDSIDVTVLNPSGDDREHFADYLPADAWCVLFEPTDLEEEGRHYLERVQRPQDYHSVSSTMRQLSRFPSVFAAGVPAGSLETTSHLPIESIERFSGDITKVRDELDSTAGEHRVIIACQTEAEIERLREIFGQTSLAAAGRLQFVHGRLKAGFRLVPAKVVLVSGGELFHRADVNRQARRPTGRMIDSFLDLRPGDYVVHLSHGIGRYRGLKVLDNQQQVEEHLVLEFQDDTKIYVPSSKINLVQKYVGGAKGRPILAKIGGKSWVRQKQAAEEAVTDLASDMLELQAARASRSGISFAVDTPWQREFDASFPYTETPDQLSAMSAIKSDMHQSRPMDRLLCGDVGFGKTEMAMRAAFKAVDSGYQVAVLVPTTILAEQHLRTFTARMAEFPFTIRSLSRFNSPKQQKEILQGLATGAVDVAIGTHRLAQADVQFENLGLLVIDEEQRFGVDIKERLKRIRHSVDVLTMTATPIPRTLHMSLLGVRDISNLETPPNDRLAIETRVTRFDDQLVRHAVLRELNRGGQIYFVHNRVNDIKSVASKLSSIVPEARIGIGHGQMAEGDLEKVMLDFIEHKFDVLVATTIVESGLDIPNANTMFIDEADRYGLADLHQLRGRVGRFKHRAYCYLLVDPAKHLSGVAAKRLRAIEEFSDMGSGFAISMRDLELRGAGNLLGTQQSGHIATVGYELYCQLLEQAVLRLKKLPPKKSIDVDIDLPGQAYIPPSYVPDMRLKIDLYRRLAKVATQAELNELREELTDRFGPWPAEVDHLLTLAQLRIWAHHWQIRTIHLEPGYAVFAYTKRKVIEQLAIRSRKALRIVDDRTAYLPLGKDVSSPDAILAAVKSLLQIDEGAAYNPPRAARTAAG